MKKILLLIVAVFITLKGYTQAKEERSWLLPDHYKVQFAGNIGFLSVGAGYMNKSQKLETDIFAGFVPKSIGGDHIISTTVKLTYLPWYIHSGEKYTIVPFTIGSYLSYSFGSQFDTLLPNQYPEGYYWWATSLRFGAFMGGKIQRSTSGKGLFKSVDVYYELGTYDLLFISYVQNMDALSVPDIFSLALGVKMRIE